MHFISLSSVVVVGLFTTINLSISLCIINILTLAFVLMQYFHTLYSTDALKTVWYEVRYTANQGLQS